MPRVSAAHEQEVRDRIVRAATRVFAEHGFHRATMQDIVRESGLSVGAIYTYFKSKSDLILAGCDLITDQELGELRRRLSAITDLNWIRYSGALAWLSWLFLHIFKLIGFRNRLVVLLKWAGAYFTFQRSVRLITGARHPEPPS